MKDNIESKKIGNRKIIIELRFDHKVILSDKKGAIVEKIKSLNLFASFHWEIGLANLSVFDHSKRNESRNTIILELNRFSFISTKIDSIESYYNNFEKIYSEIVSELGPLNIQRIGCRIQGTYYTKSNDIGKIITNMKSSFPSTFLLNEYPTTDILFQNIYKNGMYSLGPAKEKDDSFVQQTFDISYRKKHVGVAIDTDNYLTNENNNISEKQAIKDVFVLSLSVEKDLYSNLKDF